MIWKVLKQIWKQRSVNVWLWLELVVVFVCLAYLVDYLYINTCTYLAPFGYDTEHVYRVYLSKVTSESEEYVANEPEGAELEQLQTVMQRLRAFPGVEVVSASSYGHPYNMGYSNGSRGIDTVWVHGHIFTVSAPFFEVFRIPDSRGQIEPLMASALEENTLIISQETERKFALDGVSALGQGIKMWGDDEASATVRAISADVRYDELSPPYPVYFSCLSEAEVLRKNGTGAEICIRVRPEADGRDFFSNFRNEMRKQLRIGNIYLMDVLSFKDLRTNYYRMNGSINEIKTYLAGFSFLLINIFMGVIGTFWIRTQQRRSEIGLHIALGSSRLNVRRMLFFEGTLLLMLAAIPAFLITGNLIYLDLFVKTDAEVLATGRFVVGHAITFGVLLVMILVGIYFPARQAMQVNPATALHSE